MEDNHLQNSLLFLSPSSTNMNLSKTPTTHSKNKMSIDEFISNLSKSNKVVPDDEVNVNWMAANSSIKTPSGTSKKKSKIGKSESSKTLSSSKRSYRLQTESSSSKHNFNAARRLQKVQNTKRIIESHKKQLVAEKNKLKKVYEHTVDELNSERRQHDIMQHDFTVFDIVHIIKLYHIICNRIFTTVSQLIYLMLQYEWM